MKHKFGKTNYTVNWLTIDHEYAYHYGSEDNKNVNSNASLSSATAATVSLGFNDNGFKWPKKEWLKAEQFVVIY